MNDWIIAHALAIQGVGILLFTLCVVSLGKRIGRRWKQEAEIEKTNKAPDVQFLEGALDDDAPRKPNPNYSYRDFQRDLHDKGLTFEEIYEKCGGVFPKKPEVIQGIREVQNYGGPLQGFQGPQGFIDFSALPRPFSGYSGYSGHSGYGGMTGPAGEDGRSSDRMKELQMWFEERGKSSPLRKLVAPPPAPHTIIHKIYTRGRR